MQGKGVTFYNTGTDSSYGGIEITGQASGYLYAPSSADILFFQDRSMCATPTMKSCQANIVTGGSTLDLDGMLYFPTTPLTFAGGSSGSAHHTVLGASTLKFTRNSYLTAFGTNDPIKRVTLAE